MADVCVRKEAKMFDWKLFKKESYDQQYNHRNEERYLELEVKNKFDQWRFLIVNIKFLCEGHAMIELNINIELLQLW